MDWSFDVRLRPFICESFYSGKMPLLSKLAAKVGTISLVEFKKSILCEISPKMDNKIITCVSEHELVTDDNIVLRQVKSQETERMTRQWRSTTATPDLSSKMEKPAPTAWRWLWLMGSPLKRSRRPTCPMISSRSLKLNGMKIGIRFLIKIANFSTSTFLSHLSCLNTVKLK